MVKVLLVTLISVSVLQATQSTEWINECASLVSQDRSFDHTKAVAVIEKHINEDKQAIELLEKRLVEDMSDASVWGTIRGASYRGELNSARSNLHYHKKIARFMAELSKNDKEKARFIDQLYIIQCHEQELAKLKKSYNKSYSVASQLRVNGLIAARKVQIKTRTAYMTNHITHSAY
jgi:hypothetical protein